MPNFRVGGFVPLLVFFLALLSSATAHESGFPENRDYSDYAPIERHFDFQWQWKEECGNDWLENYFNPNSIKFLYSPDCVSHTRKWSFDGVREPRFERLYVGTPFLDGPACKQLPDRMFAEYRRLFPEFALLPDQTSLRREWRWRLISNAGNGNFPVDCFLQKLAAEFRLALTVGLFPRVPICFDPDHREWLGLAPDAIHEMLAYAMQGQIEAVVVLTREILDDGRQLFPEIQHYINLIFDDFEQIPLENRGYKLEFLESSRPDPVGDRLAASEKRFVEMAYARRDWESVLRRVNACQSETGHGRDPI